MGVGFFFKIAYFGMGVYLMEMGGDIFNNLQLGSHTIRCQGVCFHNQRTPPN